MKSLLSKFRYVAYVGVVLLILKIFKIDVSLDLVKNVIIGFCLFVMVLTPLVVIHEFAHFIVGKKLGAEPEVFSIGMGKKIFGFKWLDSDFIVSSIPLGGYVRFKKVQFQGENGEGTANETIAAWKWFFIALAGPLSNFVVAFLVFFGLFFYGLSYVKTRTNSEGKTLVVLTQETGQIPEFVKIISKTKAEKNVFEFTHKLSLSTIPYEQALQDTKEVGFSERVSLALSLSKNLFMHFTKLTAESLYKLVTNVTKNYHQISSPIGIAQQVKFSIELGWLYVLIIFASLSFGLGFMNILPLSILDGGRCVMAIYQSIIKKEIPVTFLNVVNNFSMLVILLLMGVGFFSDLMRNSGFDKTVKVKEVKNEKSN
jgi:regulator of sigma E protease